MIGGRRLPWPVRYIDVMNIHPVLCIESSPYVTHRHDAGLYHAYSTTLARGLYDIHCVLQMALSQAEDENVSHTRF